MSVHLLAPRLTSTDPNLQALAQAVIAIMQGIDPAATGTNSGAQVAYNPPASTANACSGYLDVTVPLRQRGLRALAGRRRISVSTQSASGHVGNRLTLVCNP